VELMDGITEFVDVELARVPFLKLRLKRGERGAQLPLVATPASRRSSLRCAFPKESISVTVARVAA
jgi:hypothetical protein